LITFDYGLIEDESMSISTEGGKISSTDVSFKEGVPVVLLSNGRASSSTISWFSGLLNAALVLFLIGLGASPLAAGEKSPRAWSFDTLRPPGTGNNAADQTEIYAVLSYMVDRWNAHDIDGYMTTLWNSPDFLYVVDGEEIMGWEKVLSAYKQGYTDLNAMGHVQIDRCMVQMITPDVALALDWWTVTFGVPNSRPVLGTSTYNLKRFPDGWKIVAFHTSLLEP
jgi:hypothetical protein